MARLAPYLNKDQVEAGCDEAGRGCLAGPVVAAAVILPHRVRIPGLDDSKKLSARKRESLRQMIEEKAVSWKVVMVEPEEIDQVNILQASFLAMHRAVDRLEVKPQSLLIDGHMFNPYPGIPHTCVVKGDGKLRSIAAASILAKCHRDELMMKLHEEFPQFNWMKNKGYPTNEHRTAIKEFGISAWHRRSFKLGHEQCRMPF